MIISVPPGRTSFSTRVDATATLGVYVDVTAQFNLQTGLITWTFTSLDPATLDLPIDPRAGFLPPNQNPPAGQGFVTYTVQPKTTLSTGTRINAQATVVFDTNAPINTAPRYNTVDAAPPTSSVTALPPTSPTTFTVRWSGTDDPGGSGIAFYDIYISDNSGPFTLWLGSTTQTSSPFTGVAGHTYGFYSVATDNVGNREATPSAAQATTTVTNSTTVTWINASGGDWDTPANWDANRVPTATDDVVINTPGITITHATAQADAVRSLTTQAAINLAAGSLSIASTSTINATFTINGGTLLLLNVTLNGSGTLVNQGTLLAQGNSTINLPYTTAAGSVLRVLGTSTGDATLTVTTGFTNNGLIELTSAGAAAAATLAVGNGTLTNAAGGSINTLAGAGGLRVLNAQFNNQGTLTIYQGTILNTSAATSNSGTLTVSSGDLTVNQSGTTPSFTNSGTITIASGRTFSLSSGVLSNFSNGTLSGGTYNIAGTFQFPNAAITTNAATIVLDGPASQIVNQSAADALANLATNSATGSFTFQNGRNFTTAAAVAFTNAGTLIVAASSTFTVSGSLTNFSGTTLTGGSYVIGGTFQFPNANIVTNAAGLVLDGSAQIVDQANTNALANLATNAAAGYFYIRNGFNVTTAGSFSNAGTLTVSYGSTFTASGLFSQTGTATVQSSGTLNLTAGGSSSGDVTNAGTLTIGAGATFTVSGTYSQTGTLLLPATATLSLTGTFRNFTGSTLTDGTYLIGGTFQFVGANIVTNAAALIFDGTSARILDQANNNALTNFAANAAAGSFTLQNSATFTTAGDFTNAGGLAIGAGSTFRVTGNLTNFASMTLTGGSYYVTGTLQFTGANLVTNAANLVLDGSAAQMVDQTGANALANFATNAAAGSFTIQNGYNLTTAGDFTNAGSLAVGAGSNFTTAANFSNAGSLAVSAGSTFRVAGNLTNFSGTTLTGGTYVIAGTFQFTGANLVTNAATLVLDGSAARILDQSGTNALANLAANASAGSLTIQNGYTLTTAADFSNAGNLAAGSGSTFTVTGGYTQTGGGTTLSGGTLAASGLVDIQAGVLGGAGSVAANVRNNGLVIRAAQGPRACSASPAPTRKPPTGCSISRSAARIRGPTSTS
jgi:hypothetical protein